MSFDLPQFLRDVRVLVDQQRLDAKALQIFDSQVLLAALVVEKLVVVILRALGLSHEAVMVALGRSSMQPTQHIVKVGTGEAEADQQEGLGYEIATQCRDQRGPVDVVFLVLFLVDKDRKSAVTGK